METAPAGLVRARTLRLRSESSHILYGDSRVPQIHVNAQVGVMHDGVHGWTASFNADEYGATDAVHCADRPAITGNSRDTEIKHPLFSFGKPYGLGQTRVPGCEQGPAIVLSVVKRRDIFDHGSRGFHGSESRSRVAS